jgi:hypothetical protein
VTGIPANRRLYRGLGGMVLPEQVVSAPLRVAHPPYLPTLLNSAVVLIYRLLWF